MRTRLPARLVWIFCLTLVAIPVVAESVMLAPTRDNTLYENAVGGQSNGSGEHLFTGNTAINLARRAMLFFDLDGVIPPGATITFVELRLHQSMTIAGPETARVHRLLAGWGEGASDAFGREGNGAPPEPGDATWLHTFFNTEFWPTPGGDFDPVPSAEQIVAGDGFYSWLDSPQLVADVQGWLDDPPSNHGWVVIGNESVPTTAKRFDSRENANPELRPLLLLEYEAACEPAPESQGYWHRQCLGLPESEGGIDPRGNGRGPQSPTEPGFAPDLLECGDAVLAALGFADTSTCEGMDAVPSNDKCEKALKQTTALLLNLCSGRLQPFCPVAETIDCDAATVGELVDELGALILDEDCRRASDCAEAVNSREAVEGEATDETTGDGSTGRGRGPAGSADGRGSLHPERGAVRRR